MYVWTATRLQLNTEQHNIAVQTYTCWAILMSFCTTWSGMDPARVTVQHKM